MTTRAREGFIPQPSRESLRRSVKTNRCSSLNPTQKEARNKIRATRRNSTAAGSPPTHVSRVNSLIRGSGTMANAEEGSVVHAGPPPLHRAASACLLRQVRGLNESRRLDASSLRNTPHFTYDEPHRTLSRWISVGRTTFHRHIVSSTVRFTRRFPPCLLHRQTWRRFVKIVFWRTPPQPPA